MKKNYLPLLVATFSLTLLFVSCNYGSKTNKIEITDATEKAGTAGETVVESAPPDTLSYSRQLTDIARFIAGMRPGENGSLNTIDNKYGKSYPAVGDYRAEIFFYYDQDADFPPRLSMVAQKIKTAEDMIYFEALYNESDEVLFVFEQSSYDNNRATALL